MLNLQIYKRLYEICLAEYLRLLLFLLVFFSFTNSEIEQVLLKEKEEILI